MVDVTTAVLLVAAGVPFIEETLGRRAATLSSVTELIYIFFAVGSTCLLLASALLSPPFAPARRVLTRPPVVPVSSPRSPGAARHRGGRRALEAGALEDLAAKFIRVAQAALPGQKFRRLRRAESDRRGRCMALLASFWWLRKVVLGVLF